MKGKIVRSIAVIALGSVLALTSAGVAAAGEKGSPESAGAQVLALRDQLAKSALARDAEATTAALGQLNPLLSDLAGGQRYSIQSQQQKLAGAAYQQGVEAAKAVADYSFTPQQLPPVPGLPPTPDPMKLLGDLIQKVADLVKSLLGLPVPPIPGLPTPPGLPGLPTPPGLPVPPLPLPVPVP